MDRFVLDLQHVDSQLVATASYGDRTGSAYAPLAYEERQALPAVLKLLNAEAYNPDDYSPDEDASLRERGLVVLNAMDQATLADGLRRRVGEQLMASLLPDDQQAGKVFQHALEVVGPNLPVEMRFDADDALVGAMPWELLRYDDDFLFRGGRGTLSRRLNYARPVGAWQPQKVDQLRVLMIAPRPRDVPALDDADLEAMRSIDRLQLEFLPRTTVFDFTTYLQTHRGAAAPHIIHFDGHGVYGRFCSGCRMVSPHLATTCRNKTCTRPMLEDRSRGYLAWEGPAGSVDFVSAQDFADKLGMLMGEPDPALRLVVVSACRSAVAASGGSAFSGVAQQLIKANVPAVVAMQFEIRADQAATIAQMLYRSLADGDSITRALAWARNGLREEQQWYRPVLYLRTADQVDGQLFTFDKTPPPPKPPQPETRPTDDGVQVEPFAAGASDDELIAALKRAIDPLLTERSVARALTPYVGDFQVCIEQLQAMGDYKDIHDALHQLYLFCFVPLRSQLPDMIQDQVVLSTMQREESDARKLVAGMQRIAQRRATDEDLDWVPKMVGLEAELRGGLEAVNPAAVRRAINRLARLFDDQPTHVNDLLVHAAEGLRLDKLREAMATAQEIVCQTLDAAEGSAVARGAVSAGLLEKRLDTLLLEHRRWQSLDGDLRDVRQLLLDVADVDGFLAEWPEVSVGLSKLCDGRESDDVASLKASCAQLDGLVGVWRAPHSDDAAATLRSAFRRCDTDANQRFFNVDSDVRALCNQLRPLGGLLDALVRGIARSIPVRP